MYIGEAHLYSISCLHRILSLMESMVYLRPIMCMVKMSLIFLGCVTIETSMDTCNTTVYILIGSDRKKTVVVIELVLCRC